MVPKSSERLRQKSFKTKSSKKPLVIHDESLDSTEHTLSQKSQELPLEEYQSSSSSDSVVKSRSTSKRKRASSSSKGKRVTQETTLSGKSAKKKPKKSSSKPSVEKSLCRKKNKVCPCSFMDFSFFSSNGFYWNELLEPIGCLNLCLIQVLVLVNA